jgi:hypothetical protein
MSSAKALVVSAMDIAPMALVKAHDISATGNLTKRRERIRGIPSTPEAMPNKPKHRFAESVNSYVLELK